MTGAVAKVFLSLKWSFTKVLAKTKIEIFALVSGWKMSKFGSWNVTNHCAHGRNLTNKNEIYAPCILIRHVKIRILKFDKTLWELFFSTDIWFAKCHFQPLYLEDNLDLTGKCHQKNWHNDKVNIQKEIPAVSLF